MATLFTKGFLSASSNGRGIALSQSAGSPTTLHTATAVANRFDEIYLYANVQSVSGGTLYLLWGGTSAADKKLISLPAYNSDVLIVPGYLLNGGVVVSAYTDAALLVNITGYIHTLEFV